MARHRKHQRGQALIETGLVIGLLIVMVLGIIEFGYVFFALNMVTNAARDGSRAAAASQDRTGLCGAYNSSNTAVDSLVRAQLAGIVTVNAVTIDQCTVTSGSTTPVCSTVPASSCASFVPGQIPTIKVTVTGRIPYLFGLLGSSAFNFSRAVTFRDEIRPG
jgi:Flp pilus assembly protein TadG